MEENEGGKQMEEDESSNVTVHSNKNVKKKTGFYEWSFPSN